MNLIAKGFLCIAAAAVSLSANAQFVDYGNDPAHYKWNVIRAKQYDVIYPQGTDSMAYRYASLLETTYPLVQKSLGRPFAKRYPVVLHPGNMLSNGMVAWAPRRMEIIPTPSADLYAQSWDKQLAIHESRHIIQTGKLMRGYYKGIYYLIGEQSQGLASLLVPYWFLEGDAVATETAFSKSGRGRLPEFSMVYRTRRIEGDFFSLDKWNLGSYTHYTSNYYALGYQMTAYARYKYGNDVWDKVTSRYAHHFSIPPFAKALQHVTGTTYQNLFNDTFNFLDKEWDAQEREYQSSGFKQVTLSNSTLKYNAYQYPQALNDSTVIVLRSNYKDLSALVSITHEEEHFLTYVGSINSKLQLIDNKVFWSEYVSGLRWTHENFSVLKYFDLEKKKIFTASPRERFVTSAIHPAGGIAALSQVSIEGKNSIALLDLDAKKIIKTYAIPQNEFAKEVIYTDKGDLIAATVGEEGITLREMNDAGEWHTLIEATSANLSALNFDGGRLYFESGLNGTNNIYEYNPESKKVYRITTARFGAFTPALSADGKVLLFSDFHSDGYRLAGASLHTLTREEADFSRPYRFELAEHLTRQENVVLDTAKLVEIEVEPKRYRKAAHLFSMHSWAPFYYDIAELLNLQADDLSTVVKPGVMVLSQNALNTAITQLGWYYKNGYHHGKAVFNYSGWYPIFNIEVDYGDKAYNINWVDTEEGTRRTSGRYTNRNYIEAEANMYLPFNLTSNHYVRGIQPSFSYFYTNNKYEQYKNGKMRNFQYLLSELRFYNYRKMAVQDILPRWGYQLRLQHLTTPFNTENYGNLYLARLTTYLPGLVRGNGLMLRFAYQYQDVDNKPLYLPKRLINEPRGYNYVYATQQQMAFQADYAFSLFCPDVSLTSLLYVQRVRSNVFYDLYKNKRTKHADWSTQSSVGIDLLMDCNILQANFPITLGARFINPIDYGNFQVEALFNISF